MPYSFSPFTIHWNCYTRRSTAYHYNTTTIELRDFILPNDTEKDIMIVSVYNFYMYNTLMLLSINSIKNTYTSNISQRQKENYRKNSS